MCRIVCIIAGAIAGALAWYLLGGMVSGFPLLLISAMVFIATAWMLFETFCGEEPSTSSKAVAAGTAAATAAIASSKMGKTDRDAWTDDEASAQTETAAAPAATLGSDTTAEKTAKSAAPKKPATKKAAAKKPAAKSTASKSAPSKSKSTATKPAPKKKAPAKKAGPERLKKPKGGKADDLKLISGVGPKLEGTLNGLGFWHFEQIAKWKKADIKIVDDELSFKGRIERDEWIKQAKVLAKQAKG
ncbi:MAG: hypothetical protein QNJ29_11930 [Rhizobiaceae bacterium]|nr:hypothetical protein [Rhizobiaceae bacterium]